MPARRTFTQERGPNSCTFSALHKTNKHIFCRVRPKYHIQVHLSNTFSRKGKSNPFKQSKSFTSIIRDRNSLFTAEIFHLSRMLSIKGKSTPFKQSKSVTSIIRDRKSLFTARTCYSRENHYSFAKITIYAKLTIHFKKSRFLQKSLFISKNHFSQ